MITMIRQTVVSIWLTWLAVKVSPEPKLKAILRNKVKISIKVY